MQPRLPVGNGTGVGSENRRQLLDREACCGSRNPNAGAETRAVLPPVKTEEPDGRWDVPEIRFSAVRLPARVGFDRNSDLRSRALLLEPAAPAALPERRT